MSFEKMTKNVLNISALDNKPSCSAEELKAFFDKAGVDIKDFINALIEQIAAETAAENIGANVSSVATKTLQAILSAFDEAIANRYTKNEIDAFVSEETSNLIADFDINLTTGVMTVTRKDGTVETYDTALEKVPVTFSLIEENEVYYLKITNTDGTSTQINVNTLFNEYLFSNSDELAFEITEEGNGKKVTARIRDNSIGKGKISLDLITQLEEYVQSASSSATSASSSATNASNSADSASSSASIATEKASEAETSATNAKDESLLAKSYAVGGTGIREGEDTDNAKYYKEQAASSHVHDYVNKSGDTMTGALTTPSITIGSRVSGSTVGTNSFAQGYLVTAQGERSHAEGSNTIATWSSSHAEGWNTKTEASAAHAEGYETIAKGQFSHSEGRGTIANGRHMKALGRYNIEGTNIGSDTATTGDVWIVGKGTSDTDRSNAARLTIAGKLYLCSTYSSSGADYAEITEWEDGNTNNEDRVGRFVCIEDEKMRFANSKDVRSRIGVVSAEPAVLGDAFSEEWKGKYKTDVFGRKLTKLVHYDAQYDDEGNCIQEECDSVEWILAEDYDNTQEYIRREERQEFDYFGMLGKLIVIDDGSCEVGGYCYPNDEAIATKELDENKGFYVMSRIDETHIKILLR